jgi:hypothetical protein
VVPIIGSHRKGHNRSGTDALPTIADDRQDGADDRQACSTDQHSAIERLNNWHRKAGTGLVEEPIGNPKITVDGPTAARAFVRWAGEHDLAREWKIDDLWYIASEDFTPAHDMVLPPRRVFLSALKKTPGVICTPNRRVYDHNGKLLGKTTFYQLPELPVGSIAKVAREITPIKPAA